MSQTKGVNLKRRRSLGGPACANVPARGDSRGSRLLTANGAATAEGKWLARCNDQTSNPMPLNEAKAAAMGMAKGATGDYVVTNPIAHLNGIAARLLDAA